MPRPLHLAVNVDHVATLRQARRAPYPDPVQAALQAEEAGAAGITVHLRGDRRHIQDDDVRRLRGAVRGKLNVEMAPTDEMVALAEELRPDQVTLVPERPDEVTTEGGLDVTSVGATVGAAAGRLRACGIAVSVFLDPSREQLAAVAALGRSLVDAFEINTDAYSRASGTRAREEVGLVADIARAGADRGLRVYAGHGLTTANVGGIAAVSEVEELNIGHWLVSRSVFVGVEQAVREMLHAMAEARPLQP